MPRLVYGTLIIAPSASYLVKDILGFGTFGVVARCEKTLSRETVALKISKASANERTRAEKEILQMLKQQGSEEHNIVLLLYSFESRGRYCLEFEHLDIDLRLFMERYGRVSLEQIRPVIHQLATALTFLKKSGIVHGDVKPENVMLVNHESSLQVKLIDFGLAHHISLMTPGKRLQTSWYRAPEVFLGASYDESVDVWSLGCTAVEMLLGKPLFSGSCRNDMVRHIVKTLGNPPGSMLRSGMYTTQYFNQHTIQGSPVWRIKTFSKRQFFTERTLNRLNDLYLIGRKYNQDVTDDKEIDLEYFVNLVSRMLELDPGCRIAPGEVLQHPFITMTHIAGVFETEHVNQCVEIMQSLSRRPREQQVVDAEQPSTSSSNQPPPQKRSRDADDEEAKNGPERSKGPLKKKKERAAALVPEGLRASSSSSQDAPSGSKKRSRDDTEQDDKKQRPKLPSKRRKRVLKVLQSFTDYRVTSSSSSNKRSREEEEDIEGQRRSPKKQRQESSPIPNLVPIDFGALSPNKQESAAGSRKRSRDEEEEEGLSLAMKRSKSPPGSTTDEA